MTINEIKEILIHAYAYSGFPRSLRAIQTFMALIDKRKAQGFNDPMGKEATVQSNPQSRYERGQNILAELSGRVPQAPKPPYATFAPTIEIMQDLNNDVLANLLDEWLTREVIQKDSGA